MDARGDLGALLACGCARVALARELPEPRPEDEQQRAGDRAGREKVPDAPPWLSRITAPAIGSTMPASGSEPPGRSEPPRRGEQRQAGDDQPGAEDAAAGEPERGSSASAAAATRTDSATGCAARRSRPRGRGRAGSRRRPRARAARRRAGRASGRRRARRRCPPQTPARTRSSLAALERGSAIAVIVRRGRRRSGRRRRRRRSTTPLPVPVLDAASRPSSWRPNALIVADLGVRVDRHLRAARDDDRARRCRASRVDVPAAASSGRRERSTSSLPTPSS